MQPSGFTLTAALARALANQHDPAVLVAEVPTAGGAPLEDLGAAPLEAEYVAIFGRTASLTRLGELPRLTAVWASGITPQLIRALGATRLRTLVLYQVGRTDIDVLREMTSIEHLVVGWAPRLTDLSWLSGMTALRTLVLDDVPRADLSTLPELPRVTGLHLSGGMYKPLKVSSLAPLQRLPDLSVLWIPSVRAEDGLLTPLGNLRHLKEVHAGNYFAAEESARLSAAIPEARGQILGPIYVEAHRDSQGQPVLPCPRCAGARLMITGRPALVLCPACDALRIAKHVARWEAARAAAVMPGT